MTSYCYDPLFLEHDQPGHPESRARLVHVMRWLTTEDLLPRMQLHSAQPVDRLLLETVHDCAYVDALQRFSARGGGHLDPDTYVGPRSYDAAILAAGGLVGLVGAVLEGRARNGIALLRPPGHHATPARGMGFCLLNNVAVAARAALDVFGAARVLIVDWDVHHGNGTQDIFYDSPQVLYFSTHQYPHYPGTGGLREIGIGAGRGYTVNLPLPAGVGDTGFERIFDEVLTPLAERFRPDLILISAGYDAHWSDPLAGLQLSLSGYWRLARSVGRLAESLCGGRWVVTLEGGYNLDVLGRGVADACRSLLGDAKPGPDPLGPARWPEASIDRLLSDARTLHGL